jgi:excisionase family DNA binding protein
MAASDELLTVAEAAQRARHSPKTIYRAIRAGTLRASKPASRWRIRPDDLGRWLSAEPRSEYAAGEAELPAPTAPAEVGSLERLRAIERDAA